MVSTKNNKIVLVILVIAALVRLWNLKEVPPAISMDEASIGFNAYSVLKTGGDEFGQYPLVDQRAYDDWRRSTYLFLVAPFVGLFGLHAVSIRLPAIILSLITVWAIYYIVLLLFKKRTQYALYAALLASFLVAISPWHVYISRIGHESNAYVSFAIFGILFFLQGTRQKWRFLLSMICFIISIISYFAGQVFVPLLGLGLIIVYWNTLGDALHSDKKFRGWFVIIALLGVAAMSMTFAGNAIVRFGGTSTFRSDAHYQEYTKRMERWSKAAAEGDIVGRIGNSKYLFPVEVFVQSYVSHFSPRWLFANSSAEPFKTPHLGLLYMWQLPFILIGIIVFLLHRDLDPRTRKAMILWFLLSPVPGSIATGAPHAMRTYPSVLTWQIFTAFGLLYVIFYWKKVRLLALSVIAIFVLGGLVSFIHNYFVVFPREQSGSFHYALSKAIVYVKAQEGVYQKIVFSNEHNLYQSYMLFLYYNRYDPFLYQQEGGTVSGGYAQTHAFAKYEFRPIKKDEPLMSGVLYVGNANDFNPVAPVVAQFANLDGTIAIQAVTLP